MSANNFGDHMAFRGEPAWHQAGTVFEAERKLTASEALHLADMDFSIQKAPIWAEVMGTDGTIQRVQVEDRVALFRSPTADDPIDRYLAVVGKGYEVTQNSDVCKRLDSLTEAWPVETIGALGKGETMFISLDAGEKIVGGIKSEKIHKYFLVTDTRNGGEGLQIAFTPVRVVCQNTLTAGLRQSTVKVQLAHRQGVNQELEWRVNLMGQLQKAAETTEAAFDAMAKAVLDQDGIEAVLAAAYPMPKKPARVELGEGISREQAEAVGVGFAEAIEASANSWAYYCQQFQGYRVDAMARLERLNDEYPAIANTAWGVWNAVVENEDYRKTPAGKEDSAIWGRRAEYKRAAFRAALDLAK